MDHGLDWGGIGREVRNLPGVRNDGGKRAVKKRPRRGERERASVEDRNRNGPGAEDKGGVANAIPLEPGGRRDGFRLADFTGPRGVNRLPLDLRQPDEPVHELLHPRENAKLRIGGEPGRALAVNLARGEAVPGGFSREAVERRLEQIDIVGQEIPVPRERAREGHILVADALDLEALVLGDIGLRGGRGGLRTVAGAGEQPFDLRAGTVKGKPRHHARHVVFHPRDGEERPVRLRIAQVRLDLRPDRVLRQLRARTLQEGAHLRFVQNFAQRGLPPARGARLEIGEFGKRQRVAREELRRRKVGPAAGVLFPDQETGNAAARDTRCRHDGENCLFHKIAGGERQGSVRMLFQTASRS